MKKAYQYIANNAGGNPVEGLVLADSDEQAVTILISRGLKPLTVDFSLNDTVASVTTPTFKPDGLAMYYLGLSLRIKNGMDIIVAVDDMRSQPSNFKLRLAADELLNLMRGGMKLGIAMERAGFPQRDAAIIQALEQGAKTANGLENIARDYQRTADIQRKIRGMLMEPAFMGTVGVIGIWVTMVFGVPIYQHAFAQLSTAGNSRIPEYARLFYAFSDLFDKHVIIDSILYYGGILGFVMFLRSKYFKKLLDQISTLRRFSEMVDNAALWGGFRLLIDTSISPDKIPFMLAKGAHRSDSREAFEALGNLVRGGARYPEAIRQSGFPDYIAKDAASAMSAPGIEAQTQALDMLRNILSMRVQELAEKVVTLSRILTVSATGLLVLSIAMLTFMPVLLTELKMV